MAFLYMRWSPSCCLEMLDKFQKRLCMTVGPSFIASLEPLSHCRNVASLILFYRYFFGRCLSEVAELVPLPYSRGKCIDLMTYSRYLGIF